MFNQFRGVIRFKAEGENCEQFLNSLKSKQIECFNIKFKNNALFGSIYRKNLLKIKSAAIDNKIDINIVKTKGLIFDVLKYKKRYGIVAGVFIAVALIFYMSNTVFYVDINGNKTIPEENIISLLKSNGLSVGKFIPSIDFRNVERGVMIQNDNIAWIGIHNIGGRIAVEIDEVAQKPDIVAENIPCNILADRDAQIIEVNIMNGALIPLVGDGVKKGDIIVSGTLDNKHGYSRYVHSFGKIIGRYNEKVVFSQELHTIENVKTGEIIEKSALKILDAEIPLYFSATPEINFDYSEELTPFSLFNLKLPIGILHKNYYLYDSIEKFYTQDEAAQIIKEKMSLYEKEYYYDKKIINTEIQENITDTNVSYTILYTVEGEIGKSSEIIVKK